MEDSNAAWDLNLPPLRKTFAGHFKMGNILSPDSWGRPGLLDMFLHHYNALTPENAMKPMHITPAPGVYNFEHVDKMAAWAQENGIDLIGHTLIWHAQSAPWLNKNPDGSPLTRAAAKANMEEFIKTYVGRYSGKVHSWDVINEAFIDRHGGAFSGSWRDYIRRETDNPLAVGHWFLAYANGADPALGECGSDYVFDAFYFARRYDPHALLYYNDYNEEFPIKRDAIAAMVTDINAQWRGHPHYDGRLLIEGIGMQSHHNHVHSDVNNVREAIELYIKTGVRLAMTEMDFTFGSPDEPANPLTPEQSKLQTEKYMGLFGLYMEYSRHIERVTIWGLSDALSWRSWGAPTFFNNASQAKEAFHAVTAVGNGRVINLGCACPKRECPRHGDCGVCRPAHAQRGLPTACERQRP